MNAIKTCEKQPTDSGRKAVRAGMGYTIGNLLIKGIAFLSIPIFSNLMSTADYGVFNTYAAYVSLFAVIISLGLPTSIRTARYDFEERADAYASSAVVLILGSLGLFLLLGLVLGGVLETYGGLRRSLVFLAVFSSFGTALLSYYNNLLSMEYRTKEYLALSFFYSVTSVLLSVALIGAKQSEKSYYYRALGNTLPMLAIAGYVLFRLWRRTRPRLTKEFARYGLKFGLPLIPHDLSQIVLSQFDRVMIAQLIGEAQAGLYSFAGNLGLPVQVLAVSFDTAWCPWLFEQLKQGNDRKIRRQAFVFTAILSLGVVLLMLVSPELIRLLSAPPYWDGRYVAIPVILSMYFSFLYTLPAGIEYYHKKTQYIAMGTMAVAVLNVLLNALCIPRFGYVAAAYTTVVSYALYYLFHTLIARRLCGRWVVESPALLGAIVGVTIASFLCQCLVDYWMVRWAIVGTMTLVGAIVLLALRKRWLPLVKGILSGKQK